MLLRRVDIHNKELISVTFQRGRFRGRNMSLLTVPVDCVVILAFEGVSRHPVRNNWNLPTLSRFMQPRPAC